MTPTSSEVERSADATPRLTRSAFADPPAGVRPGTRWWWDQLLNPAAEFSLADALQEVDEFADAGFGRFEIGWAQATYGTAEQRAALKAVAERAAQRGLQLDMTMGASWPWHTPTAQGELGHQELMYGRTDLTGPSEYRGPVPNALGDDQPRGKLVAVTAARILERGPAATAGGGAPASATVLDPTSLVDLSSRVEDGELNWAVPAGEWILFAFWQRTPETCGEYTNVPGPCVSLIDRASVRAGLQYVDKAQIGDAADAVRSSGYSFFEDSLEYNADELYWSPTMLNQFAERRGYDVTKYLPLLFVQDLNPHPTPAMEPTPDFELPRREGERYRLDFYETLTDLYTSEHLAVLGSWARTYGMQFRAQPAYGNPFDVTRSARSAARAGLLVDHESLGANDAGRGSAQDRNSRPQPYERPDSAEWRTAMENFRHLTSGSAQGGELEVSSELGAMFYYELGTYLRDYKRMMDKEWAAGVTRPLLHGVTHDPSGTPWPGASHFGGIVGEALNADTWPEWTHLQRLNDYWARGALVLQQGAARTDVAVLRDSFFNAPVFDPLRLEQRGYTIGYVDPRGAASAPTSRRGELFPSGPSYDAVVVDPGQNYVAGDRMPVATARALDKASAKGLKVIFVGSLPSRGASGRAPRAEDRQVKAAVRRILARPTGVRVAGPQQVPAALRRLGERPASAWTTSERLYSQLRETKDAHYYYLWNATGRPIRTTASFEAEGAPTRLDLWDGRFDQLARYRVGKGRVSMPVRLAPHATTVLMFPKGAQRPHLSATTADDATYVSGGRTVRLIDSVGGTQRVTVAGRGTRTVSLPRVDDAPIVLGAGGEGGTWSLQVRTYGPEGKVDRPAVPLVSGLRPWNALPGLASESGIGTYTTWIELPAGWVSRRRASQLDLGEFEGSVQVFVNGRLVARDLDPQSPLDVSRLLRAGTNEVRVVLATTPFNKALATPTTSITRPVFASSAANGPQTYGLLGPVRLLPSATATVRLR